MKTFLSKSLLFVVPFVLLLVFAMFLPPTPKARKSIFISKLTKDSLLTNVPGPRLILVGGSNIAFGLNSAELESQLQLHPINTSIDAGLGIAYMLSSAVKKAKEGDVIVLVAEYQHFFGAFAYGSEDLLHVLDFTPNEWNLIGWKQAYQLSRYLPRFALSKLLPTEYFNVSIHDVYNADVFNKYGDAVAHWDMEKRKFDAFKKLSGKFNSSLITELRQIHEDLLLKGCRMIITFPPIQKESFQNLHSDIKLVETELKKCCLKVIGTPEKYVMEDSLMFNTPYHLTESGVHRRTSILVSDLKQVLHTN